MTAAAARRLGQRMVPRRPPACWQEPAVSYRDSARAGRELARDTWGARHALGFARGEFELVRPFVRQFTALACRAETDPSLVGELVTLAESHGVLDEQVRFGLAALEASLVDRDRIRRGALAVDERVLAELAHSRIAGTRVLHRALYLLRDQPVDEELLALADPWLRLADLAADLAGYHADLAADRFNLLRLFVLGYGQSQAAHRLRGYRAGLRRQAVGLLPGASTAALRALATAALPDTGLELSAALVRCAPRALLLPLLSSAGRAGGPGGGAVPVPLPEGADLDEKTRRYRQFCR